jgi:hypothetical protein
MELFRYPSTTPIHRSAVHALAREARLLLPSRMGHGRCTGCQLVGQVWPPAGEHAVLVSFTRCSTVKALSAQRERIVMPAADGVSSAESASRTGVSCHPLWLGGRAWRSPGSAARRLPPVEPTAQASYDGFVEVWFGIIQRHAVRGGAFGKVRELTTTKDVSPPVETVAHTRSWGPKQPTNS